MSRITSGGCLKLALLYADMGWPVLPLKPASKVPAISRGVHAATTDRAQIKEWFTNRMDLNLGIATGDVSQLIVFDIDPRNGDGWDDWLAKAGPIDEGAVQLTAGGGMHVLTEYTREINSCKLEPGLDLLANGRYIVAHPSVVGGKKYEWEASGDPLNGSLPAKIPGRWLFQYQSMRTSISAKSYAGVISAGRRNDTLASLAGVLRHRGLNENEIRTTLETVNERCDPPLDREEVVQISRSIARYEPGRDTIVDSTAPSSSISSLLGTGESASTWLIPANEIIRRSSAIGWWIRGWVQKNALVMVHGKSGAGKTFVVLDLLLRIASGIDNWGVHAVQRGKVIYLAGEGHSGLGPRIRAWMHHYGVTDVDMWVSPCAFDLDTNEGMSFLKQVLNEIDVEPDVIVVDPLLAHMSGDENSARDTKLLLSACADIRQAFGATVILVHHTGNAAEAQQRARGSSAWRAAVDIEIGVGRRKNSTDQIAMVQLKNKDFEPAADVHIELKSVLVPGLIDQGGEQVTSAVPVIIESLPGSESGVTLEKAARIFQEIWTNSSGEQDTQGRPYVSRELAVRYFTEKKGLIRSTAMSYTSASRKEGVMARLIKAHLVESAEDGWVAVNKEFVFAMLESRAGRTADKTDLSEKSAAGPS